MSKVVIEQMSGAQYPTPPIATLILVSVTRNIHLELNRLAKNPMMHMNLSAAA